MKRILCLLLSVLFFMPALAWNAMGHQLVAQIAYDQLTPETKSLVNSYNRALEGKSKYANFVTSSIWLDVIKGKDIHWYDSLHYIDIPFSVDQSHLVPIAEMNARWAIKKSLLTLHSRQSSQRDKGLALRVLIHVVGDVHQPMHAVSLVSKQYPKGDLGGNLYLLGKNPIGMNLHKYWDNGAGTLLGSSKKFHIRNRAHLLEEKWSCAMLNPKAPVKAWVAQSHELAIRQAYRVESGTVPDRDYQLNAQSIVEKQLVTAGCRLAELLNQLPHNQYPKT